MTDFTRQKTDGAYVVEPPASIAGLRSSSCSITGIDIRSYTIFRVYRPTTDGFWSPGCKLMNPNFFSLNISVIKFIRKRFLSKPKAVPKYTSATNQEAHYAGGGTPNRKPHQSAHHSYAGEAAN